MPQIIVLPHASLCPDGAVIDAPVGRNLCDALLDNNIAIEHACEKSCACSTCHVIVREGFLSLEEPGESEEDMLDRAWGLTSTSRLSCQVSVGEDDLVIEIPRYTVNHAAEGNK